jgi:N12 class adenine-specific DNA methylase
VQEPSVGTGHPRADGEFAARVRAERRREPAARPARGDDVHLPSHASRVESREADSAPTIASGEKSKARDILTAIRTLAQLEAERRQPTQLERQALSRFAGFGPVALSLFPDPVSGKYKDATWQALGEELQGLLSDEQYASAKRTTFNAFYTSPLVIQSIHDAIGKLGVPANATVLEPGCGIGNFIGLAPKGMQFIGIELDDISGRIACTLHPHADIRIENFRDTKLSPGSIDAVIGNVPFADLKLEFKGQRLALHDFFFAKSVEALRPGGVLALVTSRFTLDKQNAGLREYLASQADFLGAIRLPSDAFSREGTRVVTDIVFLRKREPGAAAQHADDGWLATTPITIEGEEVAINGYFHRHPEMVLGKWSLKDRLYDAGYSLESTGDLGTQLHGAIDRLPNVAAPPPPSLLPAQTPRSLLPATPLDATPISEGSFFVGGNRQIYQSLDGKAVPVNYGGVTLSAGGTLTGRRIAALIGLRDTARRVLKSQNEGWSDTDRQDARRDLNFAYDRFVAGFGPINKTTFGETADGSVIRRMPNLVKFKEDPDAMLVMSLEEFDEITGQARKAAIMQRDVVGRVAPVTRVASAEQGLLASLNQRGCVDLSFIAQLYGRDESHVIEELGDLIYLDPISKGWQTADAYLSGNVRQKLAEAVHAGAQFSRNAEALKVVQPEDVLPGDIDANLAAPWIPASDIQSFATELFRVGPSSVQVAYLPKDAVWSVEADDAAEKSVAATADYGTPRAGGVWLLEQALNLKTPVIYDTFHVDGKEERVVNQEATLAAREKLRHIKERFRSWVFADPDRTERLVRIYNDTYNNLRPRLFDGSHLDFPGLNQTVTLNPHQEDAVWRGISSGNTLLAHAVGAGKTFTMSATDMKMKQAGLIRKPMYVVPNHMLEQFGREFLQLYPTAKLLVAGKEDFTRERRKHLTAKIASGEWDGIIVTHSSFERIGMSRDYQATFIRQQIQDYEHLLIDRAAGDQTRASRNIIKTIEKQKAAWEERLKNLLAESKKDDGLVFDELGVDHLFIDEAQYFKNLETPTKMERVAGIQTQGSERSFDLYMKARFLDGLHPGHGLTFATGTPISNTMVELYTMQRFLDPAGLKARGIEHFDAWAATFGEIVDSMEVSPDGASLRPRSRFAKFTNLPELQQMFRAFADVQTPEMLNLPRPALAGGKPIVVACPMSDDQRELQRKLIERYERLRSEKVDPRIDNALAITTDGRKLALDARLLSPDAVNFSESKSNALARNVRDIWEKTAHIRGTQLVFCDMGVRPTTWGYSVYEDIVAKLVAHGIPAGQIAVIGDADSDAKKQALFEKVRSGAVRVLIGSTQKMGTGTNVQKRLAALHHLDAPWKPAEVEQRDGRILRQGNSNAEVAIYRYVTSGSFDAYMWQALETKARFISQVMTGDSAVRRAEDIGAGQEFSYAEVKAIASGNPAVLTIAEADAELQRLAILKRNHADEQYVARRSVRELPETIARLTGQIAALEADMATISDQANAGFVFRGSHYSRAETLEVLAERLASVPEFVLSTSRVPLGTNRGLAFGLVLHPLGNPEVYLEGKATRLDTLARERPGARALLYALDRLVDGYAGQCERAKRDLGIAQTQLRDYQQRRDSPFPHEAYQAELSTLRDQLRVVLAGQTVAPNGEPYPTSQQLAERITALRQSRSIDASPKRATPRAAMTAEQSVTTRIRLRSNNPSRARQPSPAKDDAPPAAAQQALPTPSEPVIAEHKSNVERLLAEETPVKRRQASLF